MDVRGQLEAINELDAAADDALEIMSELIEGGKFDLATTTGVATLIVVQMRLLKVIAAMGLSEA